MNEAETRAELIDPQLKKAGWGVVENSRILRERRITDGRIQAGGKRSKPLIADYILQYNNRNIAVVEAKSDDLDVSEGVMQAKEYAKKLSINYTYSANGKEIYEISTLSAKEGKIDNFPSPDELWRKTFSSKNKWIDKFNSIPLVSYDGKSNVRYYIESATNKVLDAIANDRQRILLTLATGTGKTFLAFQIAWKLFQSRWNLKKDGIRQPRILFLADRNVLANQAYNEFHRFPDDALIRIKPNEIKKTGKVPTNGSIFFTIFQTFMSGRNDSPYFGEYPKDFFDFIIIDECHRGGANDESTWRDILEYFSPSFQLGLTATPKREGNADTYKYFGEPIYTYSLKDGINDGFLTPFKAKIIEGMMSEYTYDSDDDVEEGEIENKTYTEPDFNKRIMIPEREKLRVNYLLEQINQNEKTIVFCATQNHAAEIRDYINQLSTSTDTNYCVRVTAEDGPQGELYLEDFQNNEKNIPTILTTSQKLSTGVDARNVRNIVLLRPVNSMIEFKQIIGRGTRIFDGKDYFTIYDYVNACKLFEDPEWDGDPIEPEPPRDPRNPIDPPDEPFPPDEPKEPKKKIKIKLAEGKLIEIKPMQTTLFIDTNGRTLSAQEFIQNLYGHLPKHFKSEKELQNIWSNPKTREQLLKKLANEGYGKSELEELQKITDAEKSDIFDVLEYIAFNIKPIERKERVEKTSQEIFNNLEEPEKEFIEFILDKYIKVGFEELNEEKIPVLLNLKYGSLTDGKRILGDVDNIRNIFFNFQVKLYSTELR